MSRKRWKRLTEKGKHDFVKRTYELQLKLTDIENNWEKILDLEEAINDNIKKLFECNADCTSCTGEDRAACLLNFRKANVFFLAKIRTYETFFSDAVNYLVKFVSGIHQVFIEGKDPDEVDFEEKQKEELDEEKLTSMFT